jgi:hypothetical protein
MTKRILSANLLVETIPGDDERIVGTEQLEKFGQCRFDGPGSIVDSVEGVGPAIETMEGGGLWCVIHGRVKVMTNHASMPGGLLSHCDRRATCARRRRQHQTTAKIRIQVRSATHARNICWYRRSPLAPQNIHARVLRTCLFDIHIQSLKSVYDTPLLLHQSDMHFLQY